MAQWTAWRRFSRPALDRLANSKRGQYQIANRNYSVVDTGGSDSENVGVKQRLITKFIAGKCPSGYWFRCQYADFLDSGLEMEGKTTRRLIKKTGKRPVNNQRTPRTNENYPFW